MISPADDGGEPVCSICGGVGSEAYDGGCAECDPSVPLEASPVRASFDLDTATGAVTERSL